MTHVYFLEIMTVQLSRRRFHVRGRNLVADKQWFNGLTMSGALVTTVILALAGIQECGLDTKESLANQVPGFQLSLERRWGLKWRPDSI